MRGWGSTTVARVWGTAGGPQEASQEERGHIVIVVVGVRSASASVAR